MFKILQIAVVSALAIFLFSCAQTLEKVAQKPQVKYQSFELGKVNEDAITFIPQVAVTNPNSYPIPINALNYSLSLNSRNVFSGVNKKIGTLESKKAKTVNLPVTLTKDTLTLFKESLFKEGKVDYGVSGSVSILGFKLPFAKKDTLFLPDVKIGKFSIQNISLSKLSASLEVTIVNKNKFNLPFKGVAYQVSYQGKNISSDFVKSNGVPKQGETKLHIPLSVSPKNLGISLLSLLSNPLLNLDIKALVDVGFQKIPFNKQIGINMREQLSK